MSGNEARGRFEAAHFERYDALPARFRRLLQLAHTNYQVGWVERLLMLFPSEAGAFEHAARSLWRDRRADILLHYGPDHPELQP